ncbi:MAG: helix-turn-helix domain-containing protein [Candidatus Aenigmarchaeota archaeon]|nr:helix-turn-helix domain-containing protein [Candidatus Aenigmarchaeota archaeon]
MNLITTFSSTLFSICYNTYSEMMESVPDSEKDIHWWEASSKSRVLLTPKLKDLLSYRKKLLKLKQKDLAKILNIKTSRMSLYENYRRCPTVSIFLRWIKVLSISKEVIEKYIILFNAPKFKFKLDKFPYPEVPEHAEIIAHTLFDGTLARGRSFYYETHNPIEQNGFRKLIEKCNMSDAIYSSFSSGVKMYGLSSVASNLLINHYNFQKDRLSEKIMDYTLNDKKWINAVLRACFIDEGSAGKEKLRDNILIACSLRNETLANQILRLLRKDHSCRLCIDTRRNEFTVLLHNRSLTGFYNDALKHLPDDYYKKINIQRMINRLQPTKFKW